MKILLADDERDLSSALKRILEHDHYEVDVAYDGLQALDKYRNGSYDLLILDIMMPRMDGIKLSKTIRETDKYTPILMLTAKAEIDDMVLGLDSGADDYMTKPFQSKALLARIRALLRRKGEKTNKLVMGNTSLDPDTYTLQAKESLRLTDTEFRLIETLFAHRDNYLSTERLMDLVWDYDSEASINVVWSYLNSLRRKLEKVGSSLKIEVSRGIGYRLKEE